MLRVLEFEDYRSRETHDSAFVAARLGIAPREVDRSLRLLSRAGQVRKAAGLWHTVDESALDLRSEAARLRELRAFWLGVAKSRHEAGANGTFGFNVFACSAADLAALRELHLQFFQQAQSLIERSRPSECVALFSTQLFRLDYET